MLAIGVEAMKIYGPGSTNLQGSRCGKMPLTWAKVRAARCTSITPASWRSGTSPTPQRRQWKFGPHWGHPGRMRMLGGAKAFTLCHSLQTNGKIESSCWITTFAIWWRGIAKIQNEVKVQSMLQERLVCKMHAACLLLRIVAHIERFSFLFSCAASIIAAKMQLRKNGHSSWPKALSDIWGISKASSLLRANHHQCRKRIRCLQATNPRDGRGWQETRHKLGRQALERAKHACSLVRCPPSIWRWRRLDAKRLRCKVEVSSQGGELEPTVPLQPPSSLTNVVAYELVMHWWGFKGAECVCTIGKGAAPESWCHQWLRCC